MAENWNFVGIVSLRLFAALLCGAVVGFERKRRAKKAGIRTHCLVALGAAIFGIISKYGFIDIMTDANSADIARVAANVVSGVSFLGAGVIFLRNKSISGLTTAAGIWSVSAVGLAFGCGLYSVGAVGMICMVFCQYIIYRPLRKLEGHTPHEIRVSVLPGDENCERLLSILGSIDKELAVLSMTRRTDGSVDFVFNIRCAGEFALDVYDFMRKYPFITHMSI